MEDCIFCKIINNKAPSMKLYEDEYTVAFMDIAKDVDGHLLVVSKTHFTNTLDCSDEYLINLMRTVKKISNHLVDDCGYEGVNLLNASDVSAGQSVFHFHIHVIPRKTGDKIKAWPAFGGAKTETEKIYKKIKMI